MACIIDIVKAKLAEEMGDGASPHLLELDTLKSNVQAGTVVEVKGYDPENKENLLSVYHSPSGWKQFTYDGKKFSTIEGAYKYALVKKVGKEKAGNAFYNATATSKGDKTYRKNEGYTARNSTSDTLREETIDEQYKLDEMETVLMAYFTANENAKKMLLDTGNRTVKHKYGAKDTSPQVYNKVIGKVREQLKNGTTQKSKNANVYFGSGENAELSNLAYRPFTYSNYKFESVEHAYQSLKSGEGLDKTVYNDKRWDNVKNGKAVKVVGKKGTKTEKNWNVNKLMKMLVHKSFQQNPNAWKALLATKGQEITHTQDTGVWGKEFPRLLMELRDGKVKEATDSAVDTKSTPEFNKLPEYKEGQKNMTYAGIGSRQTPKEVLKLMTKAADWLASKGYKLQTGTTFRGKEEGADKAFSDGTTNKELFPPESATEVAKTIAKELHPAPQYLKEGGLKLMARNAFQVFGKELDTPVDFVLFYAEETSDPMRPKGGTGQAVEMARRKGIPTINMANKNWRKQLTKAIKKEETDDEVVTTEAISNKAFFDEKLEWAQKEILVDSSDKYKEMIQAILDRAKEGLEMEKAGSNTEAFRKEFEADWDAVLKARADAVVRMFQEQVDDIKNKIC